MKYLTQDGEVFNSIHTYCHFSQKKKSIRRTNDYSSYKKVASNSMHNRKSVIAIYLIPDIVIPCILVPGYPQIQAHELM